MFLTAKGRYIPMLMSPRAKKLYRYHDWLEYIENCKGLKVEENSNYDYYHYIKGVERIRNLEVGEKEYMMAYDTAIFKVRRRITYAGDF